MEVRGHFGLVDHCHFGFVEEVSLYLKTTLPPVRFLGYVYASPKRLRLCISETFFFSLSTRFVEPLEYEMAS